MTIKAAGKVVFIAHAYRGDEEANLKRVEAYVRFAVSEGVYPCCPWYAMVRALDDSDEDIRAQGLRANFSILSRCDELWVCGDRITPGVQDEIDQAFLWRIPTRYINDEEIGEDQSEEGTVARTNGRENYGGGRGTRR
jgi:hypothetical protein